VTVSQTLFLCGDVMTGRGIDQILRHPSRPEIFEICARDAREYVALAERRAGPIPRHVAGPYIWGDAIAELERRRPAARIVNLETSVTASDDYWRGKGLNYRMHPENVDCLTAASIDACVLGNNHVLDYGYDGLNETLDVLAHAGLKTAGAGRHLAEAGRPAVVSLAGGGRVIVFAFGSVTSGIPDEWAAGPEQPGVCLLPDLSKRTAAAVVRRVAGTRTPRDIVVASVHWGSNWGYDVPPDHARFARLLIDGGVDVVHGHSSHHPRPIEVYRERPILYGCGDFINDYEGIEGYEQFRGDLSVMYFPSFAAEGGLAAMRMVPMQIRGMRLNRTSVMDTGWMRDTLDAISRDYGTRVDLLPDGSLALRWCSGVRGEFVPRGD
jgi:poly-gamma-glutamate synthesis protein (capsule biosynthesis protein)